MTLLTLNSANNKINNNMFEIEFTLQNQKLAT